MNVFVLNTGRCGSTTFTRACSHITNYTADHESRTGLVGEDRLAYPDQHIEADNRLSWFLGRLEEAYGDDAVYVHLRRRDEETARSYASRPHRGIVAMYGEQVLFRKKPYISDMDVAMDYCHTVNSNIAFFLRDKTKKMTFHLEHGRRDFRAFWDLIGAEGDLEAALAEFDVTHNASRRPEQRDHGSFAVRTARKALQVVRKLPAFIGRA